MKDMIEHKKNMGSRGYPLLVGFQSNELKKIAGN
jgi:hypothetical protein